MIARRLLPLLVFAALALTSPRVLAASPPPVVGVLYLDYAGDDDELAALRKGLAQMLISDLSASPRIQVVERLQLEAVLAELELGRSRAIDPASAAKIGKLLGARYLVLGGYFAFAGSLRVDARVVDVESGAVVKGYGVTGKGEDFLALEQALAAGLTTILHGLVPAPTPAGPPPGGIRQRPPAPPRLRTKTASRYGKALDLIDQGKKPEARAELEKVVAEEPGFGLATDDLVRLTQ